MRFKEDTRVSAYKWGLSFSNITTMTFNLFFLLIGDPGRETFDPDLLGEMVKIEQGSVLLNQIFNLIARYVQNVHSDEHICKSLPYSAGKNLAYVVLIIKNSKDMWDQVLQFWELGAQAMGNQEKKLKPLFTSRSGQKITQGKSL